MPDPIYDLRFTIYYSSANSNLMPMPEEIEIFEVVPIHEKH